MADPVGFLQALIRAGKDGEAAVQRLFADAARGMGCSVETVRYRPADVPMVGEFGGVPSGDEGERESVAATFKGRGRGRSILFFAHPDGEPAASAPSRRSTPSAAAVDNGRLHGRGVADDLAGVAVLVQGLQSVLDAGRAPAGDVVLASVPGKRRARGISALLHGGLRADAAVHLHPVDSGAGMREVRTFAAGLLEFRIAVEGRSPETSEVSHTAVAHKAVNPLDKLALIHRALQDLDARRAAAIRHPALHDATGRSTNLLVSYMAAGSEGVYSRVPPQAVLAGSLSFPPPETLRQVQAVIDAAVRETAADDDWLRDHPPRLDFVSGVTGAETPVESPLYGVVADAIGAVTGQAPHVDPLCSSAAIRDPILRAGIPTVGLGPLAGSLTQSGVTEGRVDLEDYLRTVKVAAATIVGWCGVV